MKREMRVLSQHGDTLLAEVDMATKTFKIAVNEKDPVSGMRAAEIAEVEQLFKEKRAAGYAAFNITDRQNEQIDKFDPNVDILFVPAMQGGALSLA